MQNQSQLTSLKFIHRTLTFALTLALISLAGCASAPQKDDVIRDGEEQIDTAGLQRSLDMERPADDLGFAERQFNTCDAGYGYSSTHNCRSRHFVVVHFRLQCRDSDGTVSSTNYQVRPVHSDQVKWNLGGYESFTRTDHDGFGQIRWIAPSSQKKNRLRLTVNGKFLALTAEEITRVVAPDQWCK